MLKVTQLACGRAGLGTQGTDPNIGAPGHYAVLYCLLNTAARPILRRATFRIRASRTDSSGVVCYIQVHRQSVAKIKEARVDVRCGVASGIDQGGWAYGKLGRRQPETPIRRQAWQTAGVSEVQTWGLHVP